MGNVDNSLCKNNLKLKGLKEGAEGENLHQFLETLFIACLGSDSTLEVKLKCAYRLKTVGRNKGKVMDREVLIVFQEPSIKAAVLNALWEQPELVIECQELTFHSDISPLTLKKTGLEVYYKQASPLQNILQVWLSLYIFG